MHSHTVGPNETKLSRKDLHNQGKVDVYFFYEQNWSLQMLQAIYETDQ